jgi:hypothetical protein
MRNIKKVIKLSGKSFTHCKELLKRDSPMRLYAYDFFMNGFFPSPLIGI